MEWIMSIRKFICWKLAKNILVYVDIFKVNIFYDTVKEKKYHEFQS